MAVKQMGMTLYANSGIESHCARIALSEKGLGETINFTGRNNPLPESVMSEAGSAELPILVDRSLVIYNLNIICEYLDERFPHPPLLPVNPVQRAHYRLMLFEIENQWFTHVNKLINSNDEALKRSLREELTANLINCAKSLVPNGFFMGEEFSLVDCCVIPILWRLKSFKIALPNTSTTKNLHSYMQRMFERPSFVNSLSDEESDLQEDN